MSTLNGKTLEATITPGLTINGTLKTGEVLSGTANVPRQGPQGPAGQDGYTPIKGTDYWTAADKQEIVNDVLAALPDGDEVNY